MVLLYVLLQTGASVETFLANLEPGQSFLLCVGEQKKNIQRFYVITDHKAIPCKAQTSLAAFDELFQAHFIFSVNYHESLYSLYTFIQATVFSIDVGRKGRKISEPGSSERDFLTMTNEVINILGCKYVYFFPFLFSLFVSFR